MIGWDQLPDDPSRIAVLAADYRASWDEPDDPVAIAARAKWYELRRREREMPTVKRALAEAPPAPPLYPDVPATPPLTVADEARLRARLGLPTSLVAP